jgi:hypothetical protein
VAALLAIIVADLLQIVHETGFDGMLEGYQRGSIGMPELEAWDGMTAMLAWLALGLVVVSGITFLGWLSRVVDNLPAIGGGVPAHGPRGAILWWFAPFASLVVPFQIVTDTHRRLATEDDHGRARLLLIGWWVAFLGGNYLNVILIAVGSGETLEDFRRMVTTWAITDSLDILGAVLAILVLLRIQRREDSRAGSLGPAAGLGLQAEPDPVG